MAHYKLEPTTNNLGVAHENGNGEQKHFRVKDAVDESLRVRGRRDFADRGGYVSQPGLLTLNTPRLPATCSRPGGSLHSFLARRFCIPATDRLRSIPVARELADCLLRASSK